MVGGRGDGGEIGNVWFGLVYGYRTVVSTVDYV
jgi:hypothetical protein